MVCITLNPALDLAFNLDALTLGHVNRPTSAQLAAGKGVNVARVLASLGHEVIVSGFLGEENDAFQPRLPPLRRHRRLRAGAGQHAHQRQTGRAAAA